MRTRVYVDGFNLYYGALKGTAYKWLNPVELVKHVLPAEYKLDKLRYFTAPVSGVSNPGAPARQHAYLRALGTLPDVHIHRGRFLSKTIWRPLINLPVAGRRIDAPEPTTLPEGNYPVEGSQTLPVGRYGTGNSTRKKRRKSRSPVPGAVVAEVHTIEEKGSDVNLAAHLLNDSWKDLFDAAAVISNDTDLVTPIRMVAVDQQKPVFVVCPGRWQMAPQLANVATYARHIRAAMLRDAQFPDPIPGTTISKPANW